MSELHGVVVVGSANLDVVMFVDRFAGPGETILGDRMERVAGGKGLNQAVAAARLGDCAFVGCVGEDEAGMVLTAHMVTGGVDDRHVAIAPEPTGVAFIQVTPSGENSIVVMPLANASLDPDRVTAALDAARPAVVLTQLEIPLGAVEAAAEWAAAHGGRFVLNPSPVRPLPRHLLAHCDPLVLNVAEAHALLKGLPGPLPAAVPAAHESVELATRLLTVVTSVVVTAGAGGAAVASRLSDPVHVPGVPTDPVDTTGAGDEFAGALVAALAAGHALDEAGVMANEAAARVVTLPRSRR